jgi:hypothetical protein
MRKLFTNAFQFVFNYMGLKFHHIIYSDIILVLKVNTPPPAIIVSFCAYNFITSYPQGHGIIQTISVSR